MLGNCLFLKFNHKNAFLFYWNCEKCQTEITKYFMRKFRLNLVMNCGPKISSISKSIRLAFETSLKNRWPAFHTKFQKQNPCINQLSIFLLSFGETVEFGVLFLPIAPSFQKMYCLKQLNYNYIKKSWIFNPIYNLLLVFHLLDFKYKKSVEIFLTSENWMKYLTFSNSNWILLLNCHLDFY